MSQGQTASGRHSPGCNRSPVRQLRSLLRHSGRCGDTVRTCDAVQDVLGTAPATVLPTPHTSFKLSLPRSPRTAWARPSEAAPTLTRTKPWPAVPSERRHATPGERYPPKATTTPPAGATRTPVRSPQDQRRLPRQTLYPTVHFLQCSTTAPRD